MSCTTVQRKCLFCGNPYLPLIQLKMIYIFFAQNIPGIEEEIFRIPCLLWCTTKIENFKISFTVTVFRKTYVAKLLFFCCSAFYFMIIHYLYFILFYFNSFFKGIPISCGWVRSNWNFKNIGWERRISSQIFESTYDSRTLKFHINLMKNIIFFSLRDVILCFLLFLFEGERVGRRSEEFECFRNSNRNPKTSRTTL